MEKLWKVLYSKALGEEQEKKISITRHLQNMLLKTFILKILSGKDMSLMALIILDNANLTVSEKLLVSIVLINYTKHLIFKIKKGFTII